MVHCPCPDFCSDWRQSPGPPSPAQDLARVAMDTSWAGLFFVVDCPRPTTIRCIVRFVWEVAAGLVRLVPAPWASSASTNPRINVELARRLARRLWSSFVHHYELARLGPRVVGRECSQTQATLAPASHTLIPLQTSTLSDSRVWDQFFDD